MGKIPVHKGELIGITTDLLISNSKIRKEQQDDLFQMLKVKNFQTLRLHLAKSCFKID